MEILYTLRMKELQITQIDPPPDLIDLGNGNPDLSMLPMDALRIASDKYFASNDPRPLQYGTEQGNGYFRHSLAEYLTQAFGSKVDPDLMFVTSGASSALDLICSLFTQHGDVIFAEEPSYFLALRIFQDHGLKIIPVPLDDDGLLIDRLEGLLQEYSPKFLYTIPTFQNPSGRTLSLERRDQLVTLAQEHDFYVVADEVYHLLSYTQEPPRPLASFVEDCEHVISINSFSKTLAPGLRLGWLQAQSAVINKLAGCGLLDSGGGMNPLVSAMVKELIESGAMDENISRIRSEYNTRRQALAAALARHLPNTEYKNPDGGFFFWVRFPGIDTSKLRSQVKQFDVDYRPGILFSSQDGMEEYVRMSFCHYGVGEIEEGVRRLRKIL